MLLKTFHDIDEIPYVNAHSYLYAYAYFIHLCVNTCVREKPLNKIAAQSRNYTDVKKYSLKLSDVNVIRHRM